MRLISLQGPCWFYSLISTETFRAGGQLRGDKECPFSGIRNQFRQFGGRCWKAMLGVWACFSPRYYLSHVAASHWLLARHTARVTETNLDIMFMVDYNRAV